MLKILLRARRRALRLMMRPRALIQARIQARNLAVNHYQSVQKGRRLTILILILKEAKEGAGQ